MHQVPKEGWRQMRFEAPFGRHETLWVERQANGHFRVLNVPIWLYGISVGTLVVGRDAGPHFQFVEVVEPSPGGTVRFMVPAGTVASEVYLNRIGPEATRLGIQVGPATFFDPLVVAIHLRNKDEWWPQFGEYLNELTAGGVIKQWEVGDPDEFADDPVEDADFSDSEVVHPFPTTDRQEYFRLTHQD